MTSLVEQFDPKWVFCFNPRETDINYIYDNEQGIIKMNAKAHQDKLQIGDYAVIKRAQGKGMYKSSNFIAICEIVGFEHIPNADPDHTAYCLPGNRGNPGGNRYHPMKVLLQVNLIVDEPLLNPIKYQNCVHKYNGF